MRIKPAILSLIVTLGLCHATLAQQIDIQTFVYAVKGADTLRMDKYTPPGVSPDAPCVIFLYGGGFFNGSRTSNHNAGYMKRLAEKGYTAIAIDYRLGMRALKENPPQNAKQMRSTAPTGP